MSTNVEVKFEIKRFGFESRVSDLTINGLMLKRDEVIAMATFLDLLGLRQKADVLIAAAAQSQDLRNLPHQHITVRAGNVEQIRSGKGTKDRMDRWRKERKIPVSDRIARLCRRMKHRQAQDSTLDQLERAVTLIQAAGLYDAADYIKQVTIPEIKDDQELDAS